jgi:hypothetical protein
MTRRRARPHAGVRGRRLVSHAPAHCHLRTRPGSDPGRGSSGRVRRLVTFRERAIGGRVDRMVRALIVTAGIGVALALTPTAPAVLGPFARTWTAGGDGVAVAEPVVYAPCKWLFLPEARPRHFSRPAARRSCLPLPGVDLRVDRPHTSTTLKLRSDSTARAYDAFKIRRPRAGCARSRDEWTSPSVRVCARSCRGCMTEELPVLERAARGVAERRGRLRGSSISERAPSVMEPVQEPPETGDKQLPVTS